MTGYTTRASNLSNVAAVSAVFLHGASVGTVVGRGVPGSFDDVGKAGERLALAGRCRWSPVSGQASNRVHRQHTQRVSREPAMDGVSDDADATDGLSPA